MCTSPYYLKNPNISSKKIADWIKKRNPDYKTKNINLDLKDVTFQYIRVPCGRCPSCIALKQCYIIQRCQMESLDNDLYFGTLTYSNNTIPRLNINGFNLAYADIRDVQNMLKRIRKLDNVPKFRYFFVSEFGGKRHRPHFHFLLSVPKCKTDTLADKVSKGVILHNIFLSEWRRNLGSKRKPRYVPLCDYICNSRGRNFDLHYVNPSLSNNGCSDVAFYVSKYITKSNSYVDNLKSALYYNISDYDEFLSTWKTLKPKFLISKGFGNPSSFSVKSHIIKGIEFGINSTTYDFPIYLNPITSQTFPLCPYYKQKFLSLLHSYGFLYKQDSILSDGSFIPDEYDPDQIDKCLSSFKKTQSLINDRDNFIDFIDSYDSNDFDDFVSDYIGKPININSFEISDFYESNEY